nr:MAG TPA: hypothetical protein [Caudoviricetes sp.]
MEIHGIKEVFSMLENKKSVATTTSTTDNHSTFNC